VTISGVFDAGYRSVNAPLGGDTKGAFQNGTATSAIFIKGEEVIDGDLSASFQYEINPDFVGGSGLSGSVLGSSAAADISAAGDKPYIRTSNGANGNNFVGVTSKSMGGVKFGRLNTSTLAAWGTGSVFGTALGSGYGTNGNVFTVNSSTVANFNGTAPTRFNGAVEYTTPTFSGFSARAMYVPKVNNTEAGNENNATVATLPGTNRAGVTDIGAFYTQGALNLALTQQQQKFGSEAVNALVAPGTSSKVANGDYKLTTLAANYTIGATKLYAAYWTEKQAVVASTAVPIDAAAYMFGAKHTMGKIDLMVSYAKRDDKSTTDVGSGATKAYADVDKTILGLGADYNLSKRTALWARYESKDPNTNRSGVSPTVATSSNDATKTTAVGIRHAF
jgi:predicted porin